MAQVDFGFLNDLIGFRLKQAHARYAGEAEKRMKDLGLSPQQFSILALVALNPGIIQSRLMDSLYLSRSTCGDMVDQLVRNGLMRREPIDRRSFALGLTDEGETRLSAAKTLVFDGTTPSKARLTAQEQQDLLRLLAKLADH
ncbi:MarR family winged helix-turn-helix transcriptional regulator [Falsiphaeobacter marinintestinus]|uniref:MarR family winged helix-turn-helix transcriptional regulator n=1 Tax=Falsiphaeobacter marinintestinus TaxID=1492905 RepID=UPI0011B61FC8|nr:MarR family transcriptional regulator [Phaeobacter marinintestinus]